MSRPSAFIIHIRFVSLLALGIISFPVCTPICYYPDGIHAAPQDVPCNGGSSNSVCCGPGYACLSNQICMRNNDTLDNLSSETYVRGSCTDPKWLSASCPSFCTGNQVGGEGMKKCEDSDEDSYCCLQGSECTSKCDNGSVIIRFQGEPSVVTTIGVTSTKSQVLSTDMTTMDVAATESQVLSTDKSSIGTGSASPISTGSKAMQSSAGLETHSHSRTELKIGVGMGLPLGIISLVLAAYVIWRKKRKPKPTNLPPDNGHTYRDKDKGAGPYEATQSPAYQMEPLARHELEGNHDARELPVEEHTRHEVGH